nr:GpE family phage tail protein [Escherichia coli]
MTFPKNLSVDDLMADVAVIFHWPPSELYAYSALFDHGLASKSDQRFASIRSTGNLTFSTAF